MKVLVVLLALCVAAQGAEQGLGSVYDEDERTASGEKFDPTAFTAAHRTLPFNSWVIVFNPRTRKTVKVRINDRGPFVPERIIDLTPAAANKIGFNGLETVVILEIK